MHTARQAYCAGSVGLRVLGECTLLNWHNALNVWSKQLHPSTSPESQKRSRKNRLLFCDTSIDIPPKSPFVKGGLVASLRTSGHCCWISGVWGADPAKFCGLRTFQPNKIGWNPMQLSSPDNSNLKRREPSVTNFSNSQTRLLLLISWIYVKFIW